MSGRKLIVAAALLALAQISFLSWIITGRAAILRDGQEVLLKVEPVDPRDLLRGDYVVLTYEIRNIPVKLVENAPAGEFVTEEGPIFVRLGKDADGYWRARSASLGDTVGPSLPRPVRSTYAARSQAGGRSDRMLPSASTTVSTATMYRRGRAAPSRPTCASGLSGFSPRSAATARRRSRR